MEIHAIKSTYCKRQKDCSKVQSRNLSSVCHSDVSSADADCGLDPKRL